MRIATEPYLSWYQGQPQEIQTDVSHLIVYMWPDHPLEDQLNDKNLDVQFSGWIMKDSENQFKAVGKVLALIKLTEFVFINQRGTHEDWDITWERIDKIRVAFQNSGEINLAESWRGAMEDIPERSAKWIAAASDWQKIRNSTLSDDALHSCLQRRKG